jgi:hypothetical protein
MVFPGHPGQSSAALPTILRCFHQKNTWCCIASWGIKMLDEYLGNCLGSNEQYSRHNHEENDSWWWSSTNWWVLVNVVIDISAYFWGGKQSTAYFLCEFIWSWQAERLTDWGCMNLWNYGVLFGSGLIASHLQKIKITPKKVLLNEYLFVGKTTNWG